MVYTPPGVVTEVEIANNIVQLPGGTRILALIGTGKRTKDITAEAVTQPTTHTSKLTRASVNAIAQVYDFTGPGGAQKTYETSGSSTFGGGYRLHDNDDISWSTSDNPYPASTTPQTGNAYYANYDYTGTTVNSTGLISDIAVYTNNVNDSSTSNVTKTLLVATAIQTGTAGFPGSGVLSVHTGNNTGLSALPPAGFAGTGAGWTQDGNSLTWSIGTSADYGTAANEGTVPASGVPYGVNYAYTGTVTSERFVQGATFTNPIAFTGNIASGNTAVTALSSVTGTNIVYPASGTVAGFDSLGFGRAQSGWDLTGTAATTQFVEWAPVSPTGYGYAIDEVPPVANTYFVDYAYNKSGLDYQPKNFTDYRLVVDEYGSEAEWTLIESGANAGSYVIKNVNALTLGARVAFSNGASVLTLAQMSGLGTTQGDFQGSLDQLQPKIVDMIVPITIGSGTGEREIPLSEKAAILQAVDLHCQTMANPQNKKERVGIGSMGDAEIGDATTPNTQIFTASVSLKDKRITIIAPGKAIMQIQDPAGLFQDVTVDASFMAVAFAALSANPLSDVATPLTNQQFTDIRSISAETAGHPDPEYLETEKNLLGGAGVTVIDKLGSRIFVRHQLTTDQTNQANGEFSVVVTTDFVSQAVRFTTEQFIGKKLIPQIVIPAIRGTILATMQALASEALISSIGAITVTVNPSDPTEVLATVQYVPVFPLNRIKVTFTIRTSL